MLRLFPNHSQLQGKGIPTGCQRPRGGVSCSTRREGLCTKSVPESCSRCYAKVETLAVLSTQTNCSFTFFASYSMMKSETHVSNFMAPLVVKCFQKSDVPSDAQCAALRTKPLNSFQLIQPRGEPQRRARTNIPQGAEPNCRADHLAIIYIAPLGGIAGAKRARRGACASQRAWILKRLVAAEARQFRAQYDLVVFPFSRARFSDYSDARSAQGASRRDTRADNRKRLRCGRAPQSAFKAFKPDKRRRE